MVLALLALAGGSAMSASEELLSLEGRGSR